MRRVLIRDYYNRVGSFTGIADSIEFEEKKHIDQVCYEALGSSEDNFKASVANMDKKFSSFHQKDNDSKKCIMLLVFSILADTRISMQWREFVTREAIRATVNPILASYTTEDSDDIKIICKRLYKPESLPMKSLQRDASKIVTEIIWILHNVSEFPQSLPVCVVSGVKWYKRLVAICTSLRITINDVVNAIGFATPNLLMCYKQFGIVFHKLPDGDCIQYFGDSVMSVTLGDLINKISRDKISSTALKAGAVTSF